MPRGVSAVLNATQGLQGACSGLDSELLSLMRGAVLVVHNRDATPPPSTKIP